MAFTVTATQTAGAANGILLYVQVLTAAGGAGNTAYQGQTGAYAAHTAAGTASQLDSYWLLSVVDADAVSIAGDWTATTPAFTSLATEVDATNGAAYGTGFIGPNSLLTAQTLGNITSFPGSLAALEILPTAAGTNSIGLDPSSTAAYTNTAETVTTASFAPPAGSLLAAIVSSNGDQGGATQTTMSVTDSLGLTWTQYTGPADAGNMYTGIWLATYPVPVFGPDVVFGPSPAWRNQFGPLARTSKSAVLFDVPPPTTPPGSLVAPSQALPGPAWISNFAAGPHALFKQAVLADVQTSIDITTTVIAQGAANFPAPAITGANNFRDPDAAQPGPAWRNKFGPIARTTRRAVLTDVKAGASINLSALKATAIFPAPAVSTASNVPGVAAALPGPAWRNQFRGAAGKLAVRFDAPVPPTPSIGPFAFAGSEVDTNEFGGTETDANLYGGTATPVTYGGTEANANPYTGAGVTGYGGTETDANVYGGTAYCGDLGTETPVNIVLGEFNDEVINLTITASSSPFNLSGYGLQVLLKTAAGNLDSNPSTLILSSSVLIAGYILDEAGSDILDEENEELEDEGGSVIPIVITNAAGGLATVTIPHASLQNTNFTFWRCDITFSGLQQTCMFGTVTMRKL